MIVDRAEVTLTFHWGWPSTGIELLQVCPKGPLGATDIGWNHGNTVTLLLTPPGWIVFWDEGRVSSLSKGRISRELVLLGIFRVISSQRQMPFLGKWLPFYFAEVTLDKAVWGQQIETLIYGGALGANGPMCPAVTSFLGFMGIWEAQSYGGINSWAAAPPPWTLGFQKGTAAEGLRGFHGLFLTYLPKVSSW